MGPFAPKRFNTFRTPVAIREVIDAVFINFFLSREVGACKLPAGARFLLWSSEFFWPWGVAILRRGFFTAEDIANMAALAPSSQE